MNRLPNTFVTRGRGILLFAALLSADISTKSFVAGSRRSWCNGNGPWGIPVENGIMIASVVVALTVIAHFFFKTELKPGRSAYIFLAAGGVGNVLDRLVFGCVRDFFFVPWFPAFNGADVMLTVGAIGLVHAAYIRRSSKTRI